MEKFIYSLGLIALGLATGQFLRLLVDRNIIKKSIPVAKYLKYIQKTVLLFFNPIVSIGALWVVKMTDIKLIALPLLGVGALILGGILSLVSARILGLTRKQTGSLFTTGTLTNMGSFGSLICYVFFGEVSYAFVSMYRLFEEIVMFCIVYPIAKLFGSTENSRQEGINLLKIILDPFIIVSICSIIIGSSLNFSRLIRPQVFTVINAILIPGTSFLLVTTTGFYMRFSAVHKYIKECLAVSIIKFLAVPLLITTTAYLIGIGNISNGLPLKVVLVLSAMPPAFNSLIPPQIYGLDVDIANSCWLFTTGALIIVLPIIFYIQGFL